jgi:hypothetical protein
MIGLYIEICREVDFMSHRPSITLLLHEVQIELCRFSEKWIIIYCDLHAAGLRSGRYLVTARHATVGVFFGVRSKAILGE